MEKSERVGGEKLRPGIRAADPGAYEPIPETADETGAGVPMDSRLGTISSDCSVVLNRLKLEDDQSDGEKERKEDGEKEELRRSSTSAKSSTSRIPTFHSSTSRRRTTGQPADTSIQVIARGDVSSLPVHPRGKGSSGGESTKGKGAGSKDAALAFPLTRHPIGDPVISSPSSLKLGELLLHSGHEEPFSGPLEAPLLSHKASVSTGRKSPTPASSSSHFQQPGLPVLTPRPAIRAESTFSDPELPTVQHQERSGQMEAEVGSLPSAQNEVEELEESQVQAEIVSDSGEELREEEQSVDEDGGQSEIRCRPNFTPSLSEKEAESCEDSQVTGNRAENVLAKGKGLGARLQGTGEAVPLSKSKGDVGTTEGAKEKKQASLRSTVEASTARPPGPGRAKSRPSSRKCGACLCLTLPALLLLCGFSLHFWHYGTPASVAELLVQVQLEWLNVLREWRLPCSTDCSFSLVESIPEGMELGAPVLPPISQAWLDLLSGANETVSIAAFYFTLRASDMGMEEPSAHQGEEVFEKLAQLQSRGVKLQIAVNSPQTSPQDTEDFARTGAEVRAVDLQSATGGIIHTKLWAVDGKHLYVGSANMDWRSLTQVKELAAMVQNCSCLAEDASRLFGVYWYIGAHGGAPLPPYWPSQYSALTSAQHPLLVKLNGVPAHVYLSSAPPPLAAYGRTDDLSAILSVITDAREFVYISVMDYLPFTEFTQPARFWPAIDLALRDVACSRKVQVRLLVSCWSHSHGDMFVFLESLAVLHQHPLGCPIQVKVIEVPSTPEQSLIPFARVNHAKYMVTDRVAYIGTSNWSENYFSRTAGVGLVVNQTGFQAGPSQQTVPGQLKEVFMRDWTYRSSHPLSHEHAKRCGKRT
ncbi:uncharacterized protein pld7 isoform X2 [Brienomyrus brachyistius]|uniref:uncharacterized protein pld7 isoform X2 n=1 Tax=Brienomyrus brachyistius TaxID=42636 RepID=UPI0020B1DD1C|nr:uncharacterized protein pld7 isoform X2 [Brienomyrus brachyistius]